MNAVLNKSQLPMASKEVSEMFNYMDNVLIMWGLKLYRKSQLEKVINWFLLFLFVGLNYWRTIGFSLIISPNLKAAYLANYFVFCFCVDINHLHLLRNKDTLRKFLGQVSRICDGNTRQQLRKFALKLLCFWAL